MVTDPQQLEFEMAKGRSLRLADTQPHRVLCMTGSLGVTRNDGDQAVVLCEGDSYECDGSSVVMLHALVDSRVQLFSPARFEPGGSRPPMRISPLAALLARLRR